MNMILIIIGIATMLSCSKPKSDKTTLEGTWKMTEVRADPGDGSGRFLPVDQNVTITFKANGEYDDSRNDLYNRYAIVTADTVRLYHTTLQVINLFAIQELTSNKLVYFTNWPWCGGPYGEKFVKIDGK